MRAVRRGAFTLVELLVVIGIIGILVALSVPVIGKGMIVAQRVKCASNLHQIGLAITMYSDFNPQNPRRWYPPANTWVADTTRFLRDTNAAGVVFSCPSALRASTNSCYSGHPGIFSNVTSVMSARARLVDVKRPAGVVLIGDGCQGAGGLPAAPTFVILMKYVRAPRNTQDARIPYNANSDRDGAANGCVRFRHSFDRTPTANFLFADNHGEPMRNDEFREKHISLAY